MGGFRRAVLSFALTTAMALSPVIGSARAKTNVDIDNFGQVNANYYRGGQPDEDDWADLKTLGVKTIIDLQRDGNPAEQRLVEAAGMKFYRIGMTTRTDPTKEQLAQFIKLVNDPKNQPVYV